ncbi:MAG: DUF1893 domain-containing protein [Kiritimatiellia bacterium]
MKILKFLVRLFFVGAVAAAFFGVPFCWLALKPQRLLWALPLTFLLGRFFCEAMCPLGVLQGFVNWVLHPKRHVRRVCTRLPETRAQRIVRWSVFALVAGGLAAGVGAASLVLPMSVFGKAASLWWPGVALFALVMALAAFGQGRIWCNWICPYGTLFNLVSRFALLKHQVGAGCGNCRQCFERGKRKAAAPAPAAPDAVTRRETLKGVAVLAVAEKLTDGGFAEVSLPGVPAGRKPVLPPGAGDAASFARRCVGCQLCVASCPGGCLSPSTGLKDFGQPKLDFRRGYCLLDCVKCSEVCPEGAIRFLQREQRPHVHLGHAIWKKDLCVRTTTGDACTACVRKCPVRAIHLVQGFPVVDRGTCVGCGACEHVCPARPMPAIFVKGFEMQRVVNPISESDLLAEMRSRLAAGAAVVVARDGVIVAEESGRGLDPLLRLFEAGKLRRATVMDKVVGRAAAAICARGGARMVCTGLAGKGAAELLGRCGIRLEAEQTVETILNQERTGSCPMERAVAGLEDPEQMVEAIRKARRK